MFSLTRILSLNVRIHAGGVQLKSKKKNNIRALKFNKLNIQNRGAGEKKPWSKDEKPQQTQPMCNARNQTQATVICLEASALATVPSLLPRDG